MNTPPPMGPFSNTKLTAMPEAYRISTAAFNAAPRGTIVTGPVSSVPSAHCTWSTPWAPQLVISPPAKSRHCIQAIQVGL